MDGAPRETGVQTPDRIDLRRPTYERGLGPVLEIDSDQIGASKWEEMLRLTEANGKEQELYVLLHRGKFETTEISEGNELKSTSPVNFIDVLFGKRKITRVHTHPGEKDQPSDPDIQVAYRHPDRVFIILDKGGAHLLLSTRKPYPQEEVPRDLKKKRHLEVEKTSGLLKDAIQLVAGDLEQYGIGYYFCPDVSSRSKTKTFYLARRYSFPEYASGSPIPLT